MTQPGVIVLEGQVFDDDAKTSAQQTAAGVEGVNRVINALTTNSLQWLQAQNRIGQALQRNGLPLVSVKVIGKTAYLSGQVRSDLEKDKAAQVVTSTEPDITVGTNLINVVP
jgi:osmotically-inducible protein OsmY